MEHLRDRSVVRLLALVAVLGFVAAACGDDDTETTVEDATTTTTTTAPVDDADAGEGDGVTITIEGFDFEDGVSVAAGEPLRVVNEDGVAHTLTARDGTFDTGSIQGGSSTELTVEQSGQYEIYCAIHPSMEGTLTVEA